jgi:hypothetical protein
LAIAALPKDAVIRRNHFDRQNTVALVTDARAMKRPPVLGVHRQQELPNAVALSRTRYS